MAAANDDKVRSIATVWCHQPTSLSVPERLREIAGQLYWYRNPPKNDVKELAKWTAFFGALPAGSVDPDPEVMAAVEHYFYARSQVASGEYSAMNMKAMVLGYQLLKKLGADPRHNKANPTTPPSELQKRWALTGVAQGKSDLDTANLARRKYKQPQVVPPTFRMPPNFTGTLGGIGLDKMKY